MTGLERNVQRLFANKGKLFLVALDHPQYFGPLEGLEDPLNIISKLNGMPVDGFIVNPGIMRLIGAECATKKFVIRANTGSNKYSLETAHFPVVVSALRALELGADAVIVMLTVGSKSDVENIESVAKAIEEFHRFAVPVIVEIIPADPNNAEQIRTGARIAAEIGANVVKVGYTADFERVVSSCPVPVILAGGPKGMDLLAIAQAAVKAGCRGFAIGRNVFQADDLVKTVTQLEEVLRG